MLSIDDLSTLVESGKIDTVRVVHVDGNGGLSGKCVPARHFLSGAMREIPCSSGGLEYDPEPASGDVGVPPEGCGDRTMRPDFSTLRRAVWLPGTALVLCRLLDPLKHAPIPHCPQQILDRQVARAKEHGFDVVAATELEFHVFDQSLAEIRSAGLTAPWPGGGVAEGLARRPPGGNEPLMRRVRNDLCGSGVPVDASGAGGGAGQEVLGFPLTSAVAAAAQHVIAKQAAKDIAAEQGRAITFLPKWHPHLAGSACRIHLSLRAGRDPVFLDTSLPHGMARLMRAFLGGLIRGADDCAVFLAPNVNSYKRYVPGAAPAVRKVWSVDDRSAAFRLRGEGTGAIRIDCALAGADANPFLALAALIAAGLDGVAQHLDCGDPAVPGRAPPGRGSHMPATLKEARLALHGSAMLRGALGDGVVDHYVRAAEREQRAFERAVTDWEIRRGFERA